MDKQGFTPWKPTNQGKDNQGWQRYASDSLYGEEHQLVYQKGNSWKIRDCMGAPGEEDNFSNISFATAELAKRACSKFTLSSDCFSPPRFDIHAYMAAIDAQDEDIWEVNRTPWRASKESEDEAFNRLYGE